MSADPPTPGQLRGLAAIAASRATPEPWRVVVDSCPAPPGEPSRPDLSAPVEAPDAGRREDGDSRADTHKREAPPLFRVVIDSREGTPLVFPSDVPTVVRGLKTADYSAELADGSERYDDRCVCERKSLQDALMSISRERPRFQREIARLAEIHRRPGGYACLVIEAPMTEILAGTERSQVSGKAALGSFIAWSVEFGLPVWLCGGRKQAASVVLKILSKWFAYNVADPRGLRGRSKL